MLSIFTRKINFLFMKNTLRFSLTAVGIAMIGFGLFTLLFPENFSGWNMEQGSGQSYAIMAFGALCLIAGLGYKRR